MLMTAIAFGIAVIGAVASTSIVVHRRLVKKGIIEGAQPEADGKPNIPLKKGMYITVAHAKVGIDYSYVGSGLLVEGLLDGFVLVRELVNSRGDVRTVSDGFLPPSKTISLPVSKYVFQEVPRAYLIKLGFNYFKAKKFFENRGMKGEGENFRVMLDEELA